MKKRIFAIVIVIAITLTAINIKPIMNYVSDCFWGFICRQLDKEEQQRREAIERGEIVRGKDTMLIWNNKYEMVHLYEGDSFFLHKSYNSSDKIIGKIQKHKVKRGKVYIISEEGYVTVDENNLCKVYITVPENKFVSGYTMDEAGNKTYISRFVEDENIIYLGAFEEFTEEEINQFNKMK